MNVDWWIAILTLGVFLLDLFGPFDLAVCLLYLIPLFWTFRSPRPKQPFLVAAACTMLILLDTVWSASRLAWPVAICNRGLIAGTLWGIAFLLVRRKKTEADLRQSEALSQALIKSNPIGVLQLDLRGQIQEANDAFLKMVGYTREDLRAGKLSWDKLTPPEFQHGNELPTHQLQAFGVYSPVERKCLHQDGSRISVLVGGALLEPSRQRAVEYIAAIARDVTERQRAQAELARAKEAAEAANAAKSQFLANMSHELRTPLTAILGFSELLLTVNLPLEGQRQCLELIRKSGDTLLQLIDDILDLSRVEAGRLVLDTADVPLQQIIDEVMSVVRVRAEEKRLKLEVVRQGPLPERIHTDPLRLRQILVNLVDNAVKFTEQGEVCITLQSHRNEDGSSRLQFLIADTGIGIPPDKMEEIFQPFVQADASLTRRFGGTGLGLAISKRLAKALHGDIAATSEYGRGSTFILTVDVDALGKDRTPPGSHGLPAVGKKSPTTAPKLQGRVLLAEDVPGIQLFVRELLRTMNLEVDIAEDGRRACELAEQSKVKGQPYDLILMDIQMPVMNGHEATRWLRERGWPGPIFALTAHVMAGDREKCLEAGCDGHIAKPVSATELQDILIRYLSQVPR